MHRSNLAFESQHLLHALEANGIKNWVSLSEGQQGSLGWLTTNERKVRVRVGHDRTRSETERACAQEQMCLLLREAMNVGRIAISPYFFSVELEKLEARKRIKEELLNVRHSTIKARVCYLLTNVCPCGSTAS